MKKREVGRLKNIKYNEKTNDLEITIFVTDPRFKKKILREYSLSDEIEIISGSVCINEDDDAKL